MEQDLNPDSMIGGILLLSWMYIANQKYIFYCLNKACSIFQLYFRIFYLRNEMYFDNEEIQARISEVVGDKNLKLDEDILRV